MGYANFEPRITCIDGPGDVGELVMDVRHGEFMAMADEFLGKRFDREKLARVEALQLALHEAMQGLARALQSHEIDRVRYLDEVSKLNISIALQCETILGSANFIKLFGTSPAEIGSVIDPEVFLSQT
jgi:hypothetical protein